jgi:predicted AlkP superfamily phosphohydrolase/phosphomutase
VTGGALSVHGSSRNDHLYHEAFVDRLAWRPWKTIHSLIDASQMPHLHSIIERGAANVHTIGPADPAKLWTSIATGKTADQHGILRSLESDPISGRVRLLSGSNRGAKAGWNIAMQSGLTTYVAGWYAGYPAEELSGSFCASEFVIPTTLQAKQWPTYAGSLYPRSLANELSNLRLHPLETRRTPVTAFHSVARIH